ncbi:hypothetical protein CgunFtcFv8_004645 [Champsocephalus gunnari]|uniref:Uncharacterized protein n=1 Tax=Champsocephalus gunnari TaxID=52237 RepID=A0AAN8E0U1_CHAGU|nr:hypothetical protein CgunFtcFv8_004645 [Champsocephalus gunnari]
MVIAAGILILQDERESYCVPCHIVVWKSQWAYVHREQSEHDRLPSTLCNLRLAGSRTGMKSLALRPAVVELHSSLCGKQASCLLSPANPINFTSWPNTPSVSSTADVQFEKSSLL